jgi:uncharacterized membrane protein
MPPFTNEQETTEQPKDTPTQINRKIAATEIYGHLTEKKNLTIISFFIIFCAMILGSIKIIFALALILFYGVIYGLKMKKDIQLMKYYEQKYDIQPPKGMFQK